MKKVKPDWRTIGKGNWDFIREHNPNKEYWEPSFHPTTILEVRQARKEIHKLREEARTELSHEAFSALDQRLRDEEDHLTYLLRRMGSRRK